MLVMLRINNISLLYKQQELVSLGLGIANKYIGYEDIVIWINERHIGIVDCQ